MENESISKEDINKLPLYAYDGPVRVIYQPHDVAKAVDRLSREAILGFDTETKPVFVKGVSHPPALMQFAAEKEVVIIQLLRMTDYTAIASLLSNPNVIKAGVALGDDIKKLKGVFEFEPAGFEELGYYCKALGLKQTGLRPLTAMLFGYRISKREQRSNWAREDLTPAQITYAATDAWMSRELFLGLRKMKAEMPEPAATEAQLDLGI